MCTIATQLPHGQKPDVVTGTIYDELFSKLYLKIIYNGFQFHGMAACDNPSGAHFTCCISGHHIYNDIYIWIPFVGGTFTCQGRKIISPTHKQKQLRRHIVSRILTYIDRY